MAFLVSLPCLLFEDDHLLAVHKPPRLNTHAPSPYAGEGLYDWLRHREPRWASLAIIHRLDKETSGVLVFAKSDLAKRSLTCQFTERTVDKLYLFLTDRPFTGPDQEIRSTLQRAGPKYVSRPASPTDPPAITRFRRLPDSALPPLPPRLASFGPLTGVEARPLTGRTHQIRVHAAQLGFPVLGDSLYGGSAADRLFLHAAQLSLTHPQTGQRLTFTAPSTFHLEAWRAVRLALLDPDATTACRWIHGASDGWPGWHVDQLGSYLLSQSDRDLSAPQTALLHHWPRETEAAGWPVPVGCHHKRLRRQVRLTSPREAAPQPLYGQPAPHRFVVRENSLQFELSLEEGYSVGLFLDQRDNRRRLLCNHVAAGFPLFPDGLAGRTVLNTFAYTCAFSVCAAHAGARTTSLDLSRKYLAWGRDHFLRNHLDPQAHDFIYGDALEWLPRLARKGRAFDLVILDPPTFSQSKSKGLFRAEHDYGRLAQAALPLVKPNGLLFASTNAAKLAPEPFQAILQASLTRAGRRLLQHHYVPQPPDFPISHDEPAHLKTLWMRLS